APANATGPASVFTETGPCVFWLATLGSMWPLLHSDLAQHPVQQMHLPILCIRHEAEHRVPAWMQSEGEPHVVSLVDSAAAARDRLCRRTHPAVPRPIGNC